MLKKEETVKGIVGDLNEWDHCHPSQVTDPVLQAAVCDIVSFVFRAQSHEQLQLSKS